MNISEKKSNYGSAYVIVIAFWIVNAVYTLTKASPETIAKYNITETSLFFIQLSVILPTLVMWLVLAYAIVTLGKYVESIGTSPDGRGYHLITLSLKVLLVQSIAMVYVNMLFEYIKLTQSIPEDVLTNSTTIARNYLSIVFTLVAFTLLFKGAKHLASLIPMETLKSQTQSAKEVLIWVIAVAAGMGYIWLVFQNPTRTVSLDPLIKPTYALSDPLIISTIILPYLAIWLLGVLTIKNILLFREQVQGEIYKKGLKNFVVGLLLITLLSVFLQVLTQFSGFLSAAVLNVILVIVYGIYAVTLVGYLLIASGAKKLNQLEQI